MTEHAMLSASSAYRWINCPPSARLCHTFEDKASSYAKEGTEAHSLCEYKLKTAIGIEAKDPTGELAYYGEEMERCTTEYVDFVLELLETEKQTYANPVVLIEQKLDFSKYVPGGFGTGDCVIVTDKNLHVIDFKYGRGVSVDAKNNSQMKLYALGTLEMFMYRYNISNISMTVFQPRRENVSTSEISKDELLSWATDVLKPAAILAFDGRGKYRCGEWCWFCKAKVKCRTRAEENMKLAKFEFVSPSLLKDQEIEKILPKLDQLTNWAADIKTYALQAAISGKQWKNWKLVEGRSSRKYKNEKIVAEIVSMAGYDPFEYKILGITAMEKALGKAKFNELLGGYIEKPQGKPMLIRVSDKSNETSAKDEFKNNFTEEF